MRGALFDLPHLVTSAPQTLTSHGVADRAKCMGGDFLESVPAGGDTYLLSLVLHDWPDPQAQRILANIAAASSGARLLVLDFVIPPGDTPHMSKISDLNMLAMMGGKERTETEWRELLEAAAFTAIQTRQAGTPFSVIQATVK
jgi:predicted O-methyltransferase YrrM